MNRNHDIINIKSRNNANENIFIEGNVIKKSNRAMLIEKTNLGQKDNYGNITLSSSIYNNEYKKKFAVILFSDKENEAKFFNDLNQARIFYEKLIIKK